MQPSTVADLSCQRYSSKCKFISEDLAGGNTLPTDFAASVLLYKQISKENSIDVNDRYPRCCCWSRGAVGQMRFARAVHFAGTESFRKRLPCSHADLDKTDDKSG